MKNKIFSLFGLFLVAAFVTSCDNDQDVSPMVSIAKPAMTINFPTAVTVSEGDEIPYTITLSEPVGQEFKVYVVLDQQNSTADGNDSDVDASSVNTTTEKVIVFPPFTTSISGVIKINEDDLAETSENLRLIFGETRTSAVTFQPVVSNITINNVIKDELVLDFDVNRSFSGSNGYTNQICSLEDINGDVYDVDYLLLDNNFADLVPPNLDAQTAKCKETMTIKLSDVPDGLYHIVAALFTNASLDEAIQTFPYVGAGDFAIPVTVDYLRSGSINKGSFTQEAVNQFTASTPEGTLTQVVDVKISTVNGVRKFTVQSTDPTNPIVAASGKLSNKVKYVAKHKK